MTKEKTVLKGKEWHDYLDKHGFKNIIEHWNAQMILYSGVTWKHENILKLGDYYFVFKIRRGYKNISALKRLL